MSDHNSTECDCPAASDNYPHTEADHVSDCGYIRYGRTDEACGGCWGCLAAQAIYYSERAKAVATTRADTRRPS